MCNTGYYSTSVLHVKKYMWNIAIYPTHELYRKIKHVYTTHVIHLYFYTCNTPKNTTHVLQV